MDIRKGGAGKALDVVERARLRPSVCGVGAAYLLDAEAAAARTRWVEEFSTGSVRTFGLPCSIGLILEATSGKTPLSYFSTSDREFHNVVQLN